VRVVNCSIERERAGSIERIDGRNVKGVRVGVFKSRSVRRENEQFVNHEPDFSRKAEKRCWCWALHSSNRVKCDGEDGVLGIVDKGFINGSTLLMAFRDQIPFVMQLTMQFEK
jgi:hypothetical protein